MIRNKKPKRKKETNKLKKKEKKRVIDWLVA